MREAAVLATLLLTSCSSLMRAEKQFVRFTGGDENVPTRLTTPDGEFDLNSTRGVVALTRSKHEIPATLTCGKNKTRVLLSTSYDLVFGLFGNVFFGLVPGVIADWQNDKTWEIDTPISLDKFCPNAGGPKFRPPGISRGVM